MIHSLKGQNLGIHIHSKRERERGREREREREREKVCLRERGWNTLTEVYNGCFYFFPFVWKELMRYEEGSFKTFQLENKQFRKIVLNVCQAFLSFKTENVEIYEAPTMHISVTFNGRKNVFFSNFIRKTFIL